MSKVDLEHRALQLSLLGTVLMAVMGIGFGIYLNAKSILLDGFFSFLSMGMTGLSLFTSYLIQRPNDRRFQFGYAHLEPLLNSVNGIVILVLCLISFAFGIQALLSGGNELAFSQTLYYSIPVTLLCIILWLYESWVARKTRSELVSVDSREWLVDAILSSTLTIGFVIGFYLQQTEYVYYTRYVDSILVILLSFVAIVIPIRVLRRNLGEVLLVAPPEMEKKIRENVRRELAPYKVRMIGSHIAKIGRRYDVEINILLDESSPLYNAPLEKLDEVRNQVSQAISISPEDHWLSVTFTQDKEWL